MKSYTCVRLMSVFLLLIMLLGLSSSANGGITRIEDIDKVDAVISLHKVQYTDRDYKNYIDQAEYFWFDEALDDKSPYKFMYKSDNCEVAGYICAPKDYLKKEYPILIYVRGGHGTYELLPAAVGQLTNFGFIVMSSQYRGNDGGTGSEDYGGADVQDVLNMIDIAQQLPFASGQIYMLGDSRGGCKYMVR